MSIKTRRIYCFSITAIIFLALAICYRMLPDQIPVHWDAKGEPEFGSKIAIWGFAAMAVVFNVLFEVIPNMDPRRKNYLRFVREYNLLCVFMNFYIMAFIVAIIIQGFRPDSFEMVRFICVMVGITLLVAGNMTPRFKPNFSSGFKTPWGLSDDENWRKTNRLGGKLLFLAGILWLLGAFLIENKTALFVVGMTAVAVSAVIPYVMSYLWWRQKERM